MNLKFKTLSAKEKQKIRQAPRFADRVIFKQDGSLVCKRYFYYTFGMTSEKYSQKVIKRLESLGYQVALMGHTEHWNSWPRDSWWEVCVKFIE